MMLKPFSVGFGRVLINPDGNEEIPHHRMPFGTAGTTNLLRVTRIP